MDQQIQDILNDLKYTDKFPPREKADAIKSDLAARGNLRSGAGIKLIVSTYLDSASSLLDHFVAIILKNRARLDLNSEEQVVEVINQGFANVIVDARRCALSELPQDNYQKIAASLLDEKCPPILEHLLRKARLKDFDLGVPMSSVQITESQIGNLVVGAVNQSQLSASVERIIDRGGNEAEWGKVVKQLIAAISKMDESQNVQQAELFDLVKGLLQQIKLSKEDRSPSSLKVIWDKIVEASQVNAEVTKVIQQVLPLVPGLIQNLV